MDRSDARELEGEVLIAGAAEGPLLVLTEPLSVWGGVDPASGQIIATRHPQYGANISGTLLVLPRAIGSSSSSSVLLELIAAGHAPAGLVLGQTDAILLLGSIVAEELDHPPVPALLVKDTALVGLRSGQQGALSLDGQLRIHS
ncbi:MAG: aconitase X swivel domain-containing protein [Pseudomonadota bacterium]